LPRDAKSSVETETIIDLERREVLSILRDLQDLALDEPGPADDVIRWFG
jgi:hypothetical protein